MTWIHVTLPCEKCAHFSFEWQIRKCPACEGSGTRSVLVASAAVTEAEVFKFEIEVHHRTNADPDVNEPVNFDKLLESGMETEYCDWLYDQMAKPCEGCLREIPDGRMIRGGISDCSCRGRGSVLRVPCPTCGHVVFADEVTDELQDCQTCRRNRQLTILSFRPATKEEIEAAQTKCKDDGIASCRGAAEDWHGDRVPPHETCGGRGYTGPEYVEGQLVLLGEIAQ